MPWSFFFRPARSWIALRLGRVLLALVLVFGPALAFSATHSGSTGHVWNSAGYTGVSAVAACSAYVSVAYPGMVIDGYNSATGFCTGHWPSDPKQCGGSCNIGVVELSDCVVGYKKQPDGTCKSNTPPPPNCADPSLLNKYKGAGYTTASTQAGAPDYICIKGCQYDPGGVTVTYPNSNSVTGYTSGGRAGAASGKSCDMTNWPQITLDVEMSNATDITKLPPSPEVCAAQGRFYGQVNGADVCSPAVPRGTTTTSNGTTTEQTGGTGASAPAGTPPDTTTSKTTCDGQICTTTVVVVGGGGRTVQCGSVQVAASSVPTARGPATNNTCTTTSTQPQQQYCAQNPQAVQCKDDSVSGGADCGSPPSCSGDAISCAILQQQWNMRCELQKHDDSTDLGAKLANGQDPLAGKLPTPGGADQVVMSQKFANVDDMGFAAQCLPDVNVNLPLPGGSWNLHMDMTPLCHLGKLFGYLNMLSTLMLCAYMLKGSF